MVREAWLAAAFGHLRSWSESTGLRRLINSQDGTWDSPRAEPQADVNRMSDSRAGNPREFARPPRPLRTVRLPATWVWEGWEKCEEWVRAPHLPFDFDFLPQPAPGRDPPKRHA